MEIVSEHILNLPHELILYIFSFLDSSSLLSIYKVCHIFHHLGSLCWKDLCERSFNIKEENMIQLRGENIDWKRYFFWKISLINGCASWKNIYPENVPSPRMAHTSVSYNNSIVFINGQLTQTKRYSEIFFYDTEKNSFSKPSVKGTVPSFARHTSVIIGDKIYTFGGFDGFSTFYELAVFNLKTMEWNYPLVKGTPPTARTNHTAAVVGDKMYIYGGNFTPLPDGNYTILGDLHVLDTTTLTWSQPKCTGPSPGSRTAHTMKAIGKKIFVFGGGLWEPKPVNRWIAKFSDVYVLDTENMHWSLLPVKISVCSFPISFEIENFIFFYGGQSIENEQLTNSLYYFDTITYEIVEIHNLTKPKPLDLGTASVIGNKAYIFAGSSGVPVNDMLTIVFNKPNKSASNQMDISS